MYFIWIKKFQRTTFNHTVVKSRAVCIGGQPGTARWERCDVYFMALRHWIVKLQKTSHKNSRGCIEILTRHRSYTPPSPSLVLPLPPSFSQSAVSLSYFCLLLVQSIPFRPRWLLLRPTAVGLTDNARKETKASLLGYGVTEREREGDGERERGRQREKSGTQRSIVAGLTSGGHVWPEQQG